MEIDFDKNEKGLVPAIIQDSITAKVLMLGYMDQEAVDKTRASGKVTFFSRSKDRLWTKGEESGNYLELVDIKLDCDRDTLLVSVVPQGPTCHTGDDTCWGEKNQASLGFLSRLQEIIKERRSLPEDSPSYVASLFREGINKIAQKVGEEAVETIIEAKDTDNSLFLNEASDLLFHYMILLEAKGFGMEDIAKLLGERHRNS